MNKENKEIYTVVEVICGVTNAIYNFKHLKDAQTYLKKLRKKHDLGEDDVQMFESAVAEYPMKAYFPN